MELCQTHSAVRHPRSPRLGHADGGHRQSGQGVCAGLQKARGERRLDHAHHPCAHDRGRANRRREHHGGIQRGQTIIDKGAIVTPQDYTNLRTYETLLAGQSGASDRSDMLMFLGQVLYVALMIVFFMLYLRFLEPALWKIMGTLVKLI